MELEDGDCVTDYSDMRGYGGSHECSVRCPSCQSKITFPTPFHKMGRSPVPQWPDRHPLSMGENSLAEEGK